MTGNAGFGRGHSRKMEGERNKRSQAERKLANVSSQASLQNLKCKGA
jgi:hypothetical protein